MSLQTGIEWTDATWNPIRGCSRVSEGCRNCYAERVASRFSDEGQAYHGLARRRSNGEPQWTGEVIVVERHLYDPLRWKEPRKIFVNSMSDLFHEQLVIDDIAHIFAVMAIARQHTFQVLTKRAKAMQEVLSDPEWLDVLKAHVLEVALAQAPETKGGYTWPLPNVWLGVSVENQDAANNRIPALIETPAAVRFLSCEPLLGPLSFRWASWQPLSRDRDTGHLDGLRKLDWVIAGGESGPHARPMHPVWARRLRDQCVEADVPFFFKQWGEHRPVVELYRDETIERLDECDDDRVVCVDNDGTEWVNNERRCDGQPPSGSWYMERVGKKRAGGELDGRVWHQFPAVRP
jgi:protein gp37